MIKYSEWIQGTSRYNHGTKLNPDKNKFKHTKTENKRWSHVYDHTYCKVEWSNTTRKLKFYDPQVITTKLNQNLCAIRCIFFLRRVSSFLSHPFTQSACMSVIRHKKIEAPNCIDEQILVTKYGSFFCQTERGQTFPQCWPSAPIQVYMHVNLVMHHSTWLSMPNPHHGFWTEKRQTQAQGNYTGNRRNCGHSPCLHQAGLSAVRSLPAVPE